MEDDRSGGRRDLEPVFRIANGKGPTMEIILGELVRSIRDHNGPVPALKSPGMRIHLLRHGHALCSSLPPLTEGQRAIGDRVPGSWPAGHTWARIEEPCAACFAEALVSGRIRLHR